MVEFNTIASSMGGHAVGIGEMHKSIGTLPKYCCAKDNNVLTSLVHGMATTVDKFCESVGKKREEVCVVVLCEERNCRNFSDQKRVEIFLQKHLDYQVDIHRNDILKLRVAWPANFLSRPLETIFISRNFQNRIKISF